MDSRKNSMRKAHRNYNEFPNSIYGTEDYPPYPPPDYPGSEPNNITPGIPSINQSEVSNQVSSAYGPVVDGVSTRIEDGRNPRYLNGDSHGLYDNNGDNNDPQPLYRSFSQVPQRPPYVVHQIGRSGQYEEIVPDYPASIKREKKRGSCRKSNVVKVIIMAAMLVVIPLLVAMLSQNLFPTTDDLDKNPVISKLRTSMQLQQKELQNETQSLFQKFSSIQTYIHQRYPGCCGNRVDITVGDCVDDCTNTTDGDYQSCKTCHGYVTCSHERIYHRNCSDSFLVWDDNLKRCEWESPTCQ